MGDPTVEQGLAAIRRRRAQMWAVFLGYLPVIGLTAIVIRRFSVEQDTEQAMLFVALLWMALFAITIIRAGWVRCPRCGKLFHQRVLWGVVTWSNPFTRRCLNCQLPLQRAV